MITCKLDYMMFERLCRTAAYFDNDNDDYISLLYDVYENSDIGDAAAFFDNLFQYTKYYENFYEFVEDNSLKDYIIYKDDTETKEPTDEIDIEKTYENIQDNYEEIQFYGDEYRGYITY